MKWKYEKACQKAGLSEEEIQEIRKVFDSEKSKRKVNKKNKEKLEIQEVSIESIQKEFDTRFDFPDPSKNTEEDAVRQLALTYLNDFLKRFSIEEQYILLSWGILPDREVAKRLKIKKTTMQDRRKALIKKLKELFKKETDLL